MSSLELESVPSAIPGAMPNFHPYELTAGVAARNEMSGVLNTNPTIEDALGLDWLASPIAARMVALGEAWSVKLKNFAEDAVEILMIGLTDANGMAVE